MRGILVSVAAVLMVSTGALGVDLFNSNGFEDYAPGDLGGQNGWTTGVDLGGTFATVVQAPSPVVGQKAVALRVGDVQGDKAWMDHAITLPSVANQIVTVSFDVYRPAPGPNQVAQNLWWWWWDNGTPTYGLQWDLGGTLPHGWNPGAGSAATVYDRYANITMVWDFQQSKAYSWYNGVQVDNGIAMTDITKLTGWSIVLGHESSSGTGASAAYIDNFVISAVPEPATLVLAGLGALILRRRR